LALFRIACGLVILTWIATAVWHGVVGELWLDSRYGGYREPSNVEPWLFRLVGGASPGAVWSVVGVLMAGSAALVAGVGGRITPLVVLQAYLAVTGLNGSTAGLDTRLTGNCLWLLVLGSCTTTLSLDCRWRTGRWRSDRLVAAWPRYLVVHQLVLMYFFTGLQKASIFWSYAGDYAALYYIMQEPVWQRFDMSWLARFYPLTQILTVLVWYWETAAPLLLLAAWYRVTRDRRGWLRRLFNAIHFRLLYVAFGAAMHLGIFALMGLGPFTGITLSMYLCLFSPGEWRSLAAGRRGRATTADHHAIASAEPEGAVRSATAARAKAGGDSQPAWRRRAVVAFVTLHVVAVTLMSIPAPMGPMSKADFASPQIQDEVKSYAAMLQNWGVEVEPQEFGEWLRRASNSYYRTRQAILTPFRPYYELCGTEQGWHMFVGPNMYPTRLYLEIDRGDGHWETITIQGDPQYDWFAHRLDLEAWRTVIYSITFFGDRREYKHFVRWLAARAKEDFPRAERFRSRLYRFKYPTPGEVLDGKVAVGKFDPKWDEVVELRD